MDATNEPDRRPVSDPETGESPRTAIPVTPRTTGADGPPTLDEEAEHRVTVYSALGGQPFFDGLVERFYARVESDDVLLRLYPEPDDLGPARERLALFLAQYWGGPPDYSELRGHPRLRMRHAPYAIGEREKDHWLEAMRRALEESMPEAPLDEELRSEVAARMADYFDMAATHLVNRPAG